MRQRIRNIVIGAMVIVIIIAIVLICVKFTDINTVKEALETTTSEVTEEVTTERVTEPDTVTQEIVEVETTIPEIMEIETTQPEIEEQEVISEEEAESEISTGEEKESEIVIEKETELETITQSETESETTEEGTEPSTEVVIKQPESTNMALYGIELVKDGLEYDDEEDMYYVTEEINELSGTIKLSGEAQDSRILITNETGYTVLERDIKPEENFSVEDFGLVIGVNNVNVQVEYENGHVVNEEIIIYNYCEENMENLDVDFSDPDNDGLNNFLENMYGTNPDKADSDGDGLSDYEELVIIGTNANEKDSDSDGITDGDEDIDGDGLSNSEEEELGTDNCTVDSDGDLLKDYDEVKIHMTNPLNKDTDSDGISDKWEIENNSDPNTYNDVAVYRGECSSFSNRVEMELTASGSIIESFTMEVHKSDSVYLTVSLPGYMGKGYDFYLEGEFESANIKYYFDEAYLELENLNPTIYYFNEEIKELEEIETVWDGESNYVTASLPHFSTYILLNKTDYKAVWENDIKKPGEEGTGESSMNIVFVVDVSGSMRGDKIKTTKEVLNTFIDILDTEDRAALVAFHHFAYIKTGLTNDKTELNTQIDAMKVQGATRIFNGIELAVNMLECDVESGYDMIIVLTDGKDEDFVTYDIYYKDIIERAVDSGITINTIGIETVDEELLQRIAKTTGGSYGLAKVTSELKEKVEDVKQETIDYTTDSNNDGITDYYTKLICCGELRLSTGDIIPELIGKYKEFQTNNDFDGDGLTNGQEIKVKVNWHDSASIEIISNPAEVDSDRDKIDDLQEYAYGTNPMVRNINSYSIDYLYDNDNYLAADFTETYRDDELLRIRMYGGNVLSNYKVSYVNDYKKALLQFVQSYNEATYEEMRLARTKDFLYEYTMDLQFYIADCILTVESVGAEISDYGINIVSLNECSDKIKKLKVLLEKLESYKGKPDDIGWEKEIKEVKKLINEVKTQSEKYEAELNKVECNEKIESKLGRLYKNIPQNEMKKIEKYFDGFTVGIVISETAMSIYDTIGLYASIDVGIQQHEDLQEFMLWISKGNYNNDCIAFAGIEVYYALKNDEKKYISEAVTTINDAINGVITVSITKFLSKTPLGMAMELGWSIGNFISNTGTVCEEGIYIVAYGSSGMNYAEFLKNSMYYNKVSEQFYECNDESLNRLQILGQLRIVGEDKYAETVRRRSFIVQLFDTVRDFSQKEIDTICAETVDKVFNLCKDNNIIVKKDYSNAYLNEIIGSQGAGHEF